MPERDATQDLQRGELVYLKARGFDVNEGKYRVLSKRGDYILRRRGASTQAEILQSTAEDLEDRLREWELEKLTLEAAAKEAGLTYDTLQRRVARGELPNAGRKGAPRIRRCDLHTGLASMTRLVTEEGDPDLAGEILLARGS